MRSVVATTTPEPAAGVSPWQDWGMPERTVDEYADYLRLDLILNAQEPLSDHHDETLFIVIHQATELWLKLVIHELDFAKRSIAGDDLGPAFKALARVARIQHVLIESWQVLSTMTPADYLVFRHLFGKASGFQSFQYRAMEFLLGRRDARHLDAYDPGSRAYLNRILHQPSLYDDAVVLLARRGFDVPSEAIDRDWSVQYEPNDEVASAWLSVYRDVETHWDLYELAEKLVDLEHAFSRWRFEHYKTVHRIIGNKRGSGGTSGLGYLKQALDFTFFPELWDVRTLL
jgi:tryptophan 2,3-dioxygenase